MSSLKTVFDESQQTIVLLTACGVIVLAAWGKEWAITASLLGTVLGYAFFRKAMNQSNGNTNK